MTDAQRKTEIVEEAAAATQKRAARATAQINAMIDSIESGEMDGVVLGELEDECSAVQACEDVRRAAKAAAG